MGEDRWAIVGEAVTDWMTEQAWSQADLIRESGVSDMTIRPIIEGQPGNYRPATLAKISKALRRPPDALSRIRDGADPGEFPRGDDDEAPPPWEELLEGQRQITETLERLADALEQGDR